MGPGPGRLVRLTGAVITSSDEVNIALFFAAMGSVWSNSKSCDYLQERTTKRSIGTNLHSTQNGGLGILSDIA